MIRSLGRGKRKGKGDIPNLPLHRVMWDVPFSLLDKDNWPNFTDVTWQKTNDEFYSPQPTMTLPDRQ